MKNKMNGNEDNINVLRKVIFRLFFYYMDVK